ncbi:hypothetical protein [Nocardiopsis tropica]|uniref:Tetratricopeptide repeat protein n=1 Tax=Nocardiopsis tropica TaxID=109330 RepID=A0ABU7KP10_9ACTN|nr:hypothetical protein [Nocardiopsis umidischolae]MEE2050412.1 hypothetical protein [Nocardiopsis umidischolae]
MWRFGRNPARVPRGTDIEARLVSASLGADPLLRAGCEAVREGEAAAALPLLAESREDPETRVIQAEALGRAAADRPESVVELVGDGADRADVLLWLGHTLLARALRRPAGGADTRQADRKAFTAALDEARIPLEASARLRTDDAAPWAGLQTVAMGLGADREDKDRLWREIAGRSPHLFPAHLVRTRSLSATRGGSTEEMFAFAGAAADTAPEGHPLPSVLALAHAEHVRAEQKRLAAEGNTPFVVDKALGRLHGGSAQELFDLAQGWAAASEPHPGDVQAHHLFGWAFHRAGMTEAARWHLSAVGNVYCDQPWSFFGGARSQVARAMEELGVDPVRTTGGPEPS